MENRIDKLVGARIAFRRKQLGLSLSDAASSIDIDPFTFKRFEAGTKRINARQLLTICEIFEAPPSYFILCDTDAETFRAIRISGGKSSD
ncbi:helix-turn-helix domain-containing protein [Rhodoblastus acidophilus]|uniref:helix-turn-helix domain-containing protein n=1 Tax=Rhodoblastus acidophilus TaxID=1074 RepID=UPI000B4FE70C|nr:helix-turn-helix transcriptional regulator [Rhodoblastus acidophilus]PPQ40472.1 transcriptional regulator [Rhodoblastus acidophilus]RAI23042.1 transcriptional regulator [Rhodoblastus acidophilus]